MGSRGSHLRIKVIALLVSLVALWAFAAFVTMRDGLNLLWVSRLYDRVGQPSESLVDALQHERRLSLERLGSGQTGTAPEWLVAARQKTDAATKAFEEQANSTDAQWAASDALEHRIVELRAQLDELPALRISIDSGNLGRDSAARVFNETISTSFLIYSSLSTVDDDAIARNGRTLVTLSRARELLAQQDALLAGALASGRLSASDVSQFVELAGARRYLQTQAADELPDSGRARYDRFVADDYATFLDLEDRIISRSRPGSAVPVAAATWRSGSEATLDGLRQVVLDNAEEALRQSTPVVAWVVVRLLLAGGLGLLAVVASIIVSITTARSLVRQLERLREAAWQLARERLPDVVDRLGLGETVDVATEAPPLQFGTDEIGQVGQAFNAVQETAVKVAVQQAELRRSVRDVFLSLARRTQAMVHRQLTLLDAMERQDHEPAVLDDLFRIDHLATRMRRNAENLIVLSGATPGRAWRRSVPMIDVLRGAVAEVEDYTRVTVLPIEPVGLVGRAVGDLIHLVAELVENALSFSPPHTPVQVSGQNVANGYAVEIEDRGLGMGGAELARANARIAQPPEFNLAGAAQLGLYVVSKLAERHGIRVRLKDSPYGGTTAVILIPRTLIVDGTELDIDGPLTAEHDAEAFGLVAGARLDGAAMPRAGAATPGGTAIALAPEHPRPRHGADRLGTDRPGTDRLGAGTADPLALEQLGGTRRGDAIPDQRPKPHRAPGEDRAFEVPALPLPTAGMRYGNTEVTRNGFTPSGLPVRIRQASLAAPTADATAEEPDPAADGVAGGGPVGVQGATPLAGPAAAGLWPALGQPPGEPGDDLGRSPEEVRKIMESYQAGTRRGRSVTAEPTGDNADPPPPVETDETR